MIELDHEKIINLIYNSTALIKDPRSIRGIQGIFLSQLQYEFQIIPALYKKIFEIRHSHPPDCYVFNEIKKILLIFEVKSQNDISSQDALTGETKIISKLKEQITFYCSKKHIDLLPFNFSGFEIVIIIKKNISTEILNEIPKWIDERKIKSPIIIWEINYDKKNEFYILSKIWGNHIDEELNNLFDNSENKIEISPLSSISYLLDPYCHNSKIAYEILSQIWNNTLNSTAQIFTESVLDFIESTKTCLVKFKRITKVFSQLFRAFPFLGRYEKNEHVYILKKRINFNRLNVLANKFLKMNPHEYENFLHEKMKEKVSKIRKKYKTGALDKWVPK